MNIEETVIEVEVPKSYKERLDLLAIGQNIPLENDEERAKFNAVMYRDFHKLRTKTFTIRGKAIFRIK
jgi:hypothetical protein